MASQNDLFDKRTIGRHIQEGRVDKASYKKFLDQLPDLEAQAEVVDIKMHEDEDASSEGESMHGSGSAGTSLEDGSQQTQEVSGIEARETGTASSRPSALKGS